LAPDNPWKSAKKAVSARAVFILGQSTNNRFPGMICGAQKSKK